MVGIPRPRVEAQALHAVVKWAAESIRGGGLSEAGGRAGLYSRGCVAAGCVVAGCVVAG
jgi:hypothetical protein